MLKASALRKAPFLYKAFEIKPSSANIMLTNRCNLRCMMCKQWKGPFERELSAEDWKRVISDLKKNGIRSLHFTGGEPLLRNDLRELIAYGTENGFAVGMTTNGMLLDAGSLKGLVDSGLRSVAVSIDALDSEYEKVRGMAGSFAKVKKAVSAIGNAVRTRGMDAYINFTLMKGNMKELQRVKEFADGYNIPVHVCLLDRSSSIFDIEENKNDFWIKTDDDFKELKELTAFLKDEMTSNPRSLILNFPGVEYIERYFKDPRQASVPCVVSQDRIYIDPYGNLLSGCLSMGTFGNVAARSFGELQKDGEYVCAKKKMFYKICPGCSCGYMYNIRSFPGLLIADVFARAGYRSSSAKTRK